MRYVASDERTASEAAGIWDLAIGKPDLQWVTFTSEQIKGGLEENGMPTNIAANFLEKDAGIHSGTLMQDYKLHKPIAGGKLKLEDFAKEFTDAFLKARSSLYLELDARPCLAK